MARKKQKIVDKETYLQTEADISKQVINDRGISNKTAASILSALADLDKMREDQQKVKIDSLTPKYKNLLENVLSPQERRLIVSVGRIIKGTNPFSLSEIRDQVRIFQHNLLSAIITRLVAKNILHREGRGVYRIIDPDLVKHILTRCSGGFIQNTIDW